MLTYGGMQSGSIETYLLVYLSKPKSHLQQLHSLYTIADFKTSRDEKSLFKL